MAKAQVFKDQGLRHLIRLMHRHNKHAFLFLAELTSETNVSVYVTGVVFEEIIQIYNNYLEDVLGDLDDMNTDEFDTDSWLLLLMLNKFLDRLFKCQFESEQIKLTTALKAQESLFEPLAIRILPKFIEMIESDEETKNEENYSKAIPQDLFDPGQEMRLVKDFETREMNIIERKNLMFQFSFFALKAFNRVCRNVYAANVRNLFIQEEFGNICDKVERLLFSKVVEKKRVCLNPNNEMEFLKLLGNMKIIP